MSEDGVADVGSPGFNRLVEGLLENTLSAAEMRHLETLLNGNPDALDECARRMKLHAELAEVCDPVHLELRQDRRMVIEGRGTSQRVSMREIQTARFGNSRGAAYLTLDDTRAGKWGRLWRPAVLVPSLLALTVGVAWLWSRTGSGSPEALPNGPEIGTTVSSPVWTRRPQNDEEMRFWLENMVMRHKYQLGEIEAATGMSQTEILKTLTRLGIRDDNPAAKNASLSILPYPGGRHPRLNRLEVAINPQRDTKVSVFTPWAPHEYVVVDLPEAIRARNNDYLFLAHTDIATRWTKMNIHLRPLEWERLENGNLDYLRKLPDGTSFGATVKLVDSSVRMDLWLKNGTLNVIREPVAQVSVLPARVRGFSALNTSRTILRNGYILCKSDEADRWIITAWHQLDKRVLNSSDPAFRADPKFHDCSPGETVRAKGWLSFYEGTDIDAELARIEATGWRGKD